MFRVLSGRALIGCLAVLLALGHALAARPRPAAPVPRVQVRVGDHPGYTRVVFDSPARLHYKIASRSALLLAVVFEGAVLNRPLISGSLGGRKVVRAITARPRADQPTVLIRLARPVRRKVSYLVNRPGTDPKRRHQLVIDLYPQAKVKRTGRTAPARKTEPVPAAGRQPVPASPRPAAAKPKAGQPDVKFLARGTPKPSPLVAPLPLPAPISPPTRTEPSPAAAGPRPTAVKPPAAARPPAPVVKKPATVASLPRRTPWPPTRLKIPTVPVKPTLPRPQALTTGAPVLALAQWKCSSTFGHWAIVYAGRISRLDRKWALIKLERRYGYRYRPNKKGIDRSNWWCVPRRRHCYKAVSFKSFSGRYQPGLVVRFPRRLVVPEKGRIEGGVARLLDRRCRVGRAAAGPGRVKRPRGRKTGSGRP